MLCYLVGELHLPPGVRTMPDPLSEEVNDDFEYTER